MVKKNGIVAARESASQTWYPESEGITAWRDLWEKMGRAKGGNPHPGRLIYVWAHEAGFPRENIKRSAGAWCFASPEERRYWGGSLAERTRSSGFAKIAIEEGFANQEELDKIVIGWETFVEDEDAWFGLLHGEIICRK